MKRYDEKWIVINKAYTPRVGPTLVLNYKYINDILELQV